MFWRSYFSFSLILVIVLMITVPRAARAECFAYDDIARVKRIYNPVIAPNREMAAYVVDLAPPSGEDSLRNQQDIWMVNLEGDPDPRQFAFGSKREFLPLWSPSGDRLAFLSDRSGTVQIYTIYTSGGEAEKITSLGGEVTGYCWESSGERFAAVVRESKENKGDEEGYDERVIGKDEAKSRLWIIDSETGSGERISDPSIHVQAVDWIPGNLAVIASDEPNSNSAYYHSRLELIDEKTGNRTILSGNASGPVEFSPDGSRILFTFKKAHSRIPVTVPFVAVINTDGSGLQLLGKDYLGTLRAPGWHPDGDKVAAMAMKGVRGSLVHIDLEDGEMEELIDLNIPYYGRSFFDISLDGRMTVTLRAVSVSPPSLWLIDKEWMGREERKLADHNLWLAGRQLPEARVARWNSRDGTVIEGVIYLPPGYMDRKHYPAVIAVHGGPMWAWWLGWNGSWHNWAVPLACEGYVVLLPNPRGSLGYGAGFARASFNDWGGGDYEDVMAGADYLVAQGYADPGRLGICGWSYGGYMTSWIVTRTDRFKAAVAGAPVTNLFSFHGTTDITPDFLKQYFAGIAYRSARTYRDHSPLDHVTEASTPTLILQGEADSRVPPEQAYQLYRGLEQSGVETELVIYPREGHGFSELGHRKDVLRRIINWFGEYLLSD
ncbi:MAG: prolyl oligopeptidase family serine peptidase [Candidatus Latescibacteria bacterium]|nr:prolyl oligopeptidase family serine peptidase [bacterium]MBD3424655.1 prolyl oligopeptidase family serine peptidase [Candidatus Latescibacterota bacterium]